MVAETGATPRVVVVRRATEYEQLLARHATRGQADFFLRTRGQSIDEVEERHRRFDAVRTEVLAAIPAKWRRLDIDRDHVDRVLFEPDDIVVALGQDGLVANTAKYLTAEQPLIGVNPDVARYEGTLVRHPAAAVADLLGDTAAGRAAIERRTMAEARLDDGQHLVALNEIFVGHASHQSARYELRVGEASERQSSSGLIVATGTGQSGWCRSIRTERGSTLPLPAPTDPVLTLFVREAWPSVDSGATLTEAIVDDGTIEITSRMETGGTIFGDGIETDHLALGWGARATIGIAAQRLHLVV
jgi:NAD kinase